MNIQNTTDEFTNDLTALRDELIDDMDFDNCQHNKFCNELLGIVEKISVTADFSNVSPGDMSADIQAQFIKNEEKVFSYVFNLLTWCFLWCYVIGANFK